MVTLHHLAGGADRFVVVDAETTGVYNSDRIVELAMVTLSLAGEVLDVFETLIQPGRDVTATDIHGITASMVTSAPTFADVAGDVAVRLHGACLVAHNLPFDFRMLAGEYERLSADLVVVSGVDTLGATSMRLVAACETFGIEMAGAHRALHDAMATVQLLLRIAESCQEGSPAAAPFGLSRTGRVQRREDAVATRLSDPPLIVFLASRMPLAGVEASVLGYLELVGRAVADLRLEPGEREQLADFAVEYGLSGAQVAQAHRRYINDLIDAVVADNDVSDDEYQTLMRVAALLGVDTGLVERRIRSYRSRELTVTVESGMTVVFTGDHPRIERSELIARATAIGLTVQSGVNRDTRLVAAVDPESNSGKAGKARRYGIPVVAVDDLLAASMGSTIGAHGAGQAALKVLTCPDCHATWTVPATTGERTVKRCDGCVAVARPSIGAAQRAANRLTPSHEISQARVPSV